MGLCCCFNEWLCTYGACVNSPWAARLLPFVNKFTKKISTRLIVRGEKGGRWSGRLHWGPDLNVECDLGAGLLPWKKELEGSCSRAGVHWGHPALAVRLGVVAPVGTTAPVSCHQAEMVLPWLNWHSTLPLKPPVSTSRAPRPGAVKNGQRERVADPLRLLSSHQEIDADRGRRSGNLGDVNRIF